EANAAALEKELLALAARSEEEVRGMDFRLLYDAERRLFHIGYNATLDRIDGHYYDLLASEARLASYLAIVKRDVPESHWFALGRPMTNVGGAPALLSWGGTMFEYLMPNLFMKSHEGTLLARTSELAVDAQIAYGKLQGDPWGVSESAFARLDASQTYQYRSFGVPAPSSTTSTSSSRWECSAPTASSKRSIGRRSASRRDARTRSCIRTWRTT